MKIGFPNYPRGDLIKEIEWIGKNGFDFIDLFLEEDGAIPEKIDVEAVKKALKKYKLQTVGHLAWYLPIGSPVKSLRRAAIQEAIKYFTVFAKLGVKNVTVHSNWPAGMFSVKDGLEFQIESLEDLVEEANRRGINLMYEPIDTPKDNVASVAEILKRVPELYFHLDVGHANLHGRNPIEFIKRFGEKLKHVHMHDNFGEEDLHLPPGCGSIDWKTLIPFLKKRYDGTITLEIFSRDKDFALMSKNKLKALWQKS